ncbi:MAG: SusC/RagA family TonB-linked outer membrane protein [Nonlabens sp.]
MNNKIKTVFLLFLLPLFAFAQSVVNGVVTDKDNLPILGATVLVKGTQIATSTDFDGKYTLNNVPEDAILVFSYIGYSSQEVRVNGQATINTTLQEDASELDTIVLIGYGTTTKENVTAAQTTVSEEEFNNGAIVSPGQLIAGKAAGVQVTAPTGQPGAGPVIRVRAGSSLDGEASPLIVVDGIPLDQQNANLNSINPNDIESYTILKDPSAAAIYGNRASNGVIIITTKQGKLNSDLEVAYDFQFAINNNYNQLDVLSADRYRELAAERGIDPALLGDANTNWQDEIYQTGTRGIHNISLTKGWENTRMRVSLNHTGEEGTLRTSDYSRTTANINLSQNFFDSALRLRLTTQAAVESVGNADQGAIGSAVVFNPTQPVFDQNGINGYFEFLQANDGLPIPTAPRNPVGLLESLDSETENNQIRSNLNAVYRLPIDGLSFTGNAGIDYNEFDVTSIREVNSGAGIRDNGSRFFQSGYRRNLLLNGRIDYKTDFESINTKMEATVGSSFQDFTRKGQRQGTDNGVLAEVIQEGSTDRLISFFGRLNFDISDLFVLSGSVSRDGSSKFAPGDQFGTFGGASAALKLTNLDFVQNSGFLSQLKIRGGYGQTGNQEIPVSQAYIQTFTPGQPQSSVQFGDQFFTTLRPEGQVFLTWEKTSGYNVGLDFGFFDDRVTGSVDAYTRETTDLLQFNSFPDGGLENAGFQNIGATESRGLEGALNVDVIRSENLNWSINLNGTLQDLEVTNLTEGDNDEPRSDVGGIAGGVGNFIQERAIGFDPSSFHVFRQVYDTNGNPLSGVYVDVNGDNVINEADRVRYKKANPDAFFGFTSNLDYKNVFFSFTFRGQVGGYNYNNVDSNAANFTNAFNTPGNYVNNAPTTILDTRFSDQELFSDYYVQSSDFLRLDNATIGYTLDREKVDLRFSLTGTNLFTITDYTGLDPEVFGGIDNNIFPRSRGFVLGIGATF